MMTISRAAKALATLALLAATACAGPGTHRDTNDTLISGIDLDPIALTRTYEQVAFDEVLGNTDAVSDSWRLVAFRLSRKSNVQVSIIAPSTGRTIGRLISSEELGKGSHAFVVSYGQLREKIGDRSDFRLGIIARSVKSRSAQHVILKGYLTENNDGTILSQVRQHNVDLFHGSLTISKQDLPLEGRGPTFDFSRVYTNANRRTRDHSALGQGWKHSHDVRLRVIASGDSVTPFNLPQWVVHARGGFMRLGDVPRSDGRPRYVSINGSGQFKRTGDKWHAQRGYHSTLTETKDGFVFASLDGTRYSFAHPSRPAPRLTSKRPKHSELRGMHRLGPSMDAPLDSVSDRFGNTLSYEYADTSEGKYLVRAIDSVGREFRLSYHPPIGGDSRTADENADNGAGMLGEHGPAQYAHAPRRLVGIQGPGQISIQYDYARETGLLSAVRMDETLEKYHYTRESGPNGAPPVSSLRAARYNLQAIEDGVGNSTEFEYLEPKAVPANMRRVIPGINNEDVVKRIVLADGSEKRFGYEERGKNTRSVIDPRGNASHYTLNATGNPLEMREPMDTVTTMRWTIDQGEPDLLMTARTNSDGETTYFEYDDNGHEIDQLGPHGYRRQQAWSPRFLLIVKRTSTSGELTDNTYDEEGNLLETHVISRSDGETRVRYEYNQHGQATSKSLPAGGTVEFTYDRLGVLTSKRYSDGATYEWTNDTWGRTIKHIDSAGDVSLYKYDGAGQVIKEFDPESGWIENTHDRAGNVVKQVIDGTVVLYSYDSRNRVVHAETENGFKQWVYDENSNVVRETDWDGTVIRRKFDASNEEIESTTPASVDRGTSVDASPLQDGVAFDTAGSGRASGGVAAAAAPKNSTRA